MSHYIHLSIKEREMIYLMRGMGASIREIARELKRSPATISRELQRGSDSRHCYTPSGAQSRYQKRRKNCGRRRILANAKYRMCIRHYIEDLQWSPEQISNRLKLDQSAFLVSYSTIYRAIHSGLFDRQHPGIYLRKKERFLYHLRRKGKKQKKCTKRQGKFEIKHHIGERPSSANQRESTGHWEADTVIGTKGGACVVTLTDRKTRFLLMGKVQHKTAEEVNAKIKELFSRIPAAAIKTLTPDRGSEFARYSELELSISNLTVYFPAPHAPWERGTNENTNGLVREYLPKHQDMSDVSEKQIRAYEDLINHRPRKCLGWRSPYEVFTDELLHLT